MSKLQDEFHKELYQFTCQCVDENTEHSAACVATARRVIRCEHGRLDGHRLPNPPIGEGLQQPGGEWCPGAGIGGTDDR